MVRIRQRWNAGFMNEFIVEDVEKIDEFTEVHVWHWKFFDIVYIITGRFVHQHSSPAKQDVWLVYYNSYCVLEWNTWFSKLKCQHLHVSWTYLFHIYPPHEWRAKKVITNTTMRLSYQNPHDFYPQHKNMSNYSKTSLSRTLIAHFTS